MGRFLAFSALALLYVPSTLAALAVDYAPVTGVSQNGACGSGVTCVGSTFGNCCSVDGTCGATDTHCGSGCQPLFGICPSAILNKRYAEEGAEMEKRGLEARATSSLACRSAATSSITCVPSKTSVIRAAGSATVFCKSWNAAKPHATSPFVSQGILKPIGVSNACDCILADTSYSSKASTVVKATTSTSVVCVPSKTSVIRAAGSATAFCSSWNAAKPHSSSPFSAEGILLPTGVSNACDCILADKSYVSATTTKSTSKTTTKTTTKASTTTAKATTTTKKATTTTTTTKKATTTTTTSKKTTTTSKSASASACTLKKRRRRRDEDHATAAPSVTAFTA